MKNVFVAIILIALAVSLRADTELKGSPGELAAFLDKTAHTVTITGEGEVKAAADRGHITMKITTDSKSLAEAMRMNADIRSKSMAWLKEQGIGPDRIQASKFSSTAKHGPFSDKVRNQRVENVLRITVHDEKEFQAVAALPDKFSEVTYDKIEFEHSQKDELKLRAVSQACDDAERQKTLLQSKLGLRLTARRVTEQFVGRPGIGVQGGSQARYSPSVPAYSEPEFQEIAQPMPFSDLAFKVLVRVEYASEPAPKP
jgi:uncharacterized protein YggE